MEITRLRSSSVNYLQIVSMSYWFSSPAIVNILLFWKHAANILKLNEIHDYPSKSLQSCEMLTSKASVSKTLTALLSEISNEFLEDHLPTIPIGNMITSRKGETLENTRKVRKTPTSLLLDLGLLVRKKAGWAVV